MIPICTKICELSYHDVILLKYLKIWWISFTSIMNITRFHKLLSDANLCYLWKNWQFCIKNELEICQWGLYLIWNVLNLNSCFLRALFRKIYDYCLNFSKITFSNFKILYFTCSFIFIIRTLKILQKAVCFYSHSGLCLWMV